jgi:hypothetical protein
MGIPNSNTISRRIAKVTISPILVSDWLRTGAIIPAFPVSSFECIEGIPEDAKYIRGSYDSMQDEFVLFFEHPSFDEISIKDHVPEIKVNFKVTYLSTEVKNE